MILDVVAIQKERARRAAFESFMDNRWQSIEAHAKEIWFAAIESHINQRRQQNAALVQVLSAYADAATSDVLKELLLQAINAIEDKP